MEVAVVERPKVSVPNAAVQRPRAAGL